MADSRWCILELNNIVFNNIKKRLVNSYIIILKPNYTKPKRNVIINITKYKEQTEVYTEFLIIHKRHEVPINSLFLDER